MATIGALMPGSFCLDTSLPPKLDVNVGARSHFFQPPTTPSASSSLHRSTACIHSQDANNNSSRKRSRQEAFNPAQGTPYVAGLHLSLAAKDLSHAQSPPPFVSTKYELAGGLDTPIIDKMSTMEVEEEYSSVNSNLLAERGRGFRDYDPNPEGYLQHSSSALRIGGNGRSLVTAAPPLRNGLGKVVSGVVGVAGRVLEFCKETAFRGFYAGGGQGYSMKSPPRSMNGDHSAWLDVSKEKSLHSQAKIDRHDLVPGEFPDEDYIPNYMSQDHNIPPRPGKKIQREKGLGEVSAGWVMVDGRSSRESSPSRLSARKVPAAASSTRRPMSRHSRRPILPVSRLPLTSYAGSPSLRADRPASFAPTRSPLTSPKYDSPASSDVQRHAAKMRRREMEENANLKRFNQQLKAMIREGREALGTKFEIEDEPIDEGYAEDECCGTLEKG